MEIDIPKRSRHDVVMTWGEHERRVTAEGDTTSLEIHVEVAMKRKGHVIHMGLGWINEQDTLGNLLGPWMLLERRGDKSVNLKRDVRVLWEKGQAAGLVLSLDNSMSRNHVKVIVNQFTVHRLDPTIHNTTTNNKDDERRMIKKELTSQFRHTICSTTQETLLTNKSPPSSKGGILASSPKKTTGSSTPSSITIAGMDAVADPRPLSLFLTSPQGGTPSGLSPNTLQSPLLETSLSKVSLSNEQEGYCHGWMYKKKKRALQGWAKRFFVLENGILRYSKSVNGEIRGRIDLTTASVSVERRRGIINVDDGRLLFHMKPNNEEDFRMWLNKIRNFHQSVRELSSDGQPVPLPILQESVLPTREVNFMLPVERDPYVLLMESFRSDRSLYFHEIGLAKEYLANVSVAVARLPAEKRVSSFPILRMKDSKEEKKSIITSLEEVMSCLDTLVHKLDEHEAKRTLAFEKIEPYLKDYLETENITRRRYTNKSVKRDSKGNLFSYDKFSSYSSIGTRDEFFDAPERLIPEGFATYEEYTAESDDDSDNFLNDSESSDEEGKSIVSPKTVPFLMHKAQSSIVFERRVKLPSSSIEGDISLLSILRRNLGKDLSKIAMPVTLNEPISGLQKLSEDLEYCELLDKAALANSSIDRLLFVTVFAITAYSSYLGRTKKPFNPLLGETFEYIRDDKRFKFIAEKVSHHPLIAACHAESNNFTFWKTSNVKSKFWGKSMEFIPQCKVHAQLSTTKEHFVWNEVTTCVKNIMSSSKSIEHYGEMTVRNLSTGEYSKVTFKESGYFSSANNEVIGEIFNSRGEKIKSISGKWSEAIFEQLSETKLQLLWKMRPLPMDSDKYYGFTQFAMELNELTPDISSRIPKTDSRWRPDIRCLEEGQINESEKFKTFLEQNQRDQRKQLEEMSKIWTPLWFTRTSADKCKVMYGSKDSNDSTVNDEFDEWLFNGNYWNCRAINKFPESFFNNFDVSK